MSPVLLKRVALCLIVLICVCVISFYHSSLMLAQTYTPANSTIVAAPYERVSCAIAQHSHPADGQALGMGAVLRYLELDQPLATVQPPSNVPFIFSLHIPPTVDFLTTITTTLKPTVDANPGTYWFIGNEIDRDGQDGMLPEQYPPIHHVLYHRIKSWDPTAQVGNGSVVQPTPIRLAYMDRVWQAYIDQYGEEMPVDVWNVHNMILREERDSWGADIPPGINVDSGTLYNVTDNVSIEAFEQQLRAFRTWMAEKGQRNKPLFVSEYGVLMPEEYGFGSDVVNTFMGQTFQLLLTATDETTGYPADGNRLAQWWTWYSCDDVKYSAQTNTGFNGNLIDRGTNQLTETGVFAKQFLSADLSVAQHHFTVGDSTVDLEVSIANIGMRPTEAPFVIQLWNGLPNEGGELLSEQCREQPVPSSYYQHQSFVMQFRNIAQSAREIYIIIDSENNISESKEANNTYHAQYNLFIPVIRR